MATIDSHHRSLAHGALAAALATTLACGAAAPDRDAPRGASRGKAATVAQLPAGSPIVLISIDTLRSDRLPAYGYGAVATPAIDRLRRDGVLFQRAYSPIPLTTPAHASMMTGLRPPRHGVRDNAGYRLETDDPPTLATRLADLGYATGGAVSSYTLRTATGLGLGFAHYDDQIEAKERQTIGRAQRAGDATLDTLLPWLAETAAGGSPFFAFLHLYEPHTPYEPPPRFAGYTDPYDGEIAAADAVVGRLLAELDRLDVYQHAIVVLLSDHGEGLGDHGEAEHGVLLYREALQIPLVIKLPGGAAAGTEVDLPVDLMDVLPTLVDLAAGAPPVDATELDGRSLRGLLGGRDIAVRSLYAESFHGQLRYGWAGLTSLIEDRWHLIDGPDPELYDLVDDPGERRNVLRDQRRVYARLKGALSDLAAEPAPPGAIDDETRAKLESLGYLGGSRPDKGTRADPKSQLHTLDPLRRGVDALAAGARAEAIALLRQALEVNERFEAAWSYLGLAYEESGRPEEAFEAYRRAFDLTQGDPLVVDALVRMALRLGRMEDASTFLELTLRNRPEDLDSHLLATRTLLLQRRFDEALPIAEAALALAPDHPDARYQLGAVAMGRGRLDDAERHLLGAIEAAGGGHPPALQDLAVLFLSQDRRGEARRLLERLRQLQPDNQQAARLLERLGGS